MGLAERVSRRSVVKTAEAAAMTVNQCVAAVNEQATHVAAVEREIKDVRSTIDALRARLERHQKDATERMDGQGGMLLVNEKAIADVKKRIVPIERALFGGSEAERELLDTHTALMDRFYRQCRMFDAAMDDLRHGRIVLSNVGFFGRLRFLLTGRAS